MNTSPVAHTRRAITAVPVWAIASAVVALTAGAAVAQAPTRAPAAPATAANAAAEAPALNRAQIDQLLATPDKVVVLDVRRADEISSIGGFPAFLNIQAADLERYLAFVPRDRRIITVSNHAARAKRAAALLTSRGYQVAGAAGAQDYESQGGRLVGKAAPAATAAVAAPAR